MTRDVGNEKKMKEADSKKGREGKAANPQTFPKSQHL